MHRVPKDRDAGQRRWGVAPWGHGVVRLEESWDSDWEWPSLYYTELFQPLP